MACWEAGLVLSGEGEALGQMLCFLSFCLFLWPAMLLRARDSVLRMLRRENSSGRDKSTLNNQRQRGRKDC